MDCKLDRQVVDAGWNRTLFVKMLGFCGLVGHFSVGGKQRKRGGYENFVRLGGRDGGRVYVD